MSKAMLSEVTLHLGMMTVAPIIEKKVAPYSKESRQAMYR